MKQYGDCEEYVQMNTERQNKQQLKYFNLTQYRQVILEIIIHLYRALVKHMQDSLEARIVPAILESDEFKQSSHAPQGMRGRMTAAKYTEPNREVGAQKKIVGELTSFFQQFQHFGLDRCYADQIFYQIMYYICAVAMNNLLLRNICTWETGTIIRYNLSQIEKWVSDHEMVSRSPYSQILTLTIQ